MNIKARIKPFFQNPLLVLMFGFSFLLSVANFLTLFYFIKKLNNLIILHYNVYLGVDLIGDGRQILLMPLVGFCFMLINLLLAIYFFDKKERILSHILSLITLLSQMGIVIASASIIVVNFF